MSDSEATHEKKRERESDEEAEPKRVRAEVEDTAGGHGVATNGEPAGEDHQEQTDGDKGTEVSTDAQAPAAAATVSSNANVYAHILQPSGPTFIDDVSQLTTLNPAGLYSVIVEVPNDMVGRIIGREGATVRIIQNLSGGRMDIPQDSEPGSNIRKVSIVGTPSSILYCKAIIDTKVSNGEDSGIPLPVGDQVDPNNKIVAKVVPVPNDQVGRLIGKNGCTIRQMQEVSGAHVEIAKTCPPGSNQREVTLTGSELQVSRAEQLVHQKLAGQPLISAATLGAWNSEMVVKISFETESLKGLAAQGEVIVEELKRTGAVASLVKDGLTAVGDQAKLSQCLALLTARAGDNAQAVTDIQTAFAYPSQAAPAVAPAPGVPQQFATQAAAAAAAAQAALTSYQYNAAYAMYNYPQGGGYGAAAANPAAGYAAQAAQAYGAGYPGYGGAQATPGAYGGAAGQYGQYGGYDQATAAYYQQYYQQYAQAAADPKAAAANPYAAYYAAMAGQAAPQQLGAGKIATTMNVPNEIVGRIIGKSGVSIKGIQEQSGAHVDIPPDTGTPMRVLTITGDQNQISLCTNLITQKMSSRY